MRSEEELREKLEELESICEDLENHYSEPAPKVIRALYGEIEAARRALRFALKESDEL